MPEITPEYSPASQLSPDAKRKNLAYMRLEREDLDRSISITEAELAEVAPLP